ncbi:MAG: 50S ribosomal protein L32 [Bacteroidetes bacterium]|nr:50S ribosomal protein L32 [Bacteroidota bacterium]
MAHPKRKISKTRRDKRRTHDKITTKPYYIDNVSGEATLYHRVCLESGYYRGRQMMKGTDE